MNFDQYCGRGVIVECQNCDLRRCWHPSTGQDTHKHDLVTDHDVRYTDPDERRAES